MSAGLDYVIKVPEPVMSNKELSQVVGDLTAKIESLRADLVALENEFVSLAAEARVDQKLLGQTADAVLSMRMDLPTRISPRISLRRKVKAWLRERLAE